MTIRCPFCNNIVIKDMTGLEESLLTLSFAVRCPHCKEDLQIILRFERVVSINNKPAQAHSGAKARLVG